MILKKLIFPIIAILGISSVSISVQAVPSFARQTDKKCSSCHSAWPQLNRKGRAFKEQGYRLSSTEKKSMTEIMDDSGFPIAAAIKGRPFDKKNTGENNARIMHEIELFIAGDFGNSWSGNFEIEAEDDHIDGVGDGFKVEMAGAALNYSFSEAMNLSVAWAPILHNDAYGLMTDNLKLTRNRAAVIDGSKFGGADAGGKTFRDNRQVLSLSGRPISQLFYSVGISGEADDVKGIDASNLHARVAFDVTKDIMLGAFFVNGKTNATTTAQTYKVNPGTPPTLSDVPATSSPELDYSRTGIDFQGDFGNTRVQAAVISADDDQHSGGVVTGKDSNQALSVVVMHTFRTSSGKPTWVPLLRVDKSETSDGTSTTNAVTANLGYYLTENSRVFLELYDKDAPGSTKDYKRTTLQFDVLF